MREEGTAMRAKPLIVLLLAAALGAGCSASQLQARKDNAWFSTALPDEQNSNPTGYAHPLRPAAFVLYPVGVALDYALVRPFYLMAGLAPEWFGLTVDDAQKYQQHLPVLVAPQTAPQRFENLRPTGSVQP
jgi:hypothetical protein